MKSNIVIGLLILVIGGLGLFFGLDYTTGGALSAAVNTKLWGLTFNIGGQELNTADVLEIVDISFTESKENFKYSYPVIYSVVEPRPSIKDIEVDKDYEDNEEVE